jgi:hypothetical protein
MTWLRLVLTDRRRRQRGSVLSAVLIIVAFLAILVGAVMTELTSSFLLSRNQVNRMQTEATVTSAVELGIHQLQTTSVPPVCAEDLSGVALNRGPWYLTLNGRPAAVSETCTGIVPDQALALASGQFGIDGIRDTIRDRYLVENSTAFGRLYSYPFGQTGLSWSIALGGAPTAPPMTMSDPDGSVDLLVPVANPSAGCSGHCVAVYADRGGIPGHRCDMGASGVVADQPGAEYAGGGNFPGYTFFADLAGNFYAYDPSAAGTCSLLEEDSGGLGGVVVGAPLVFRGTNTAKNDVTTTVDDLFVLVTTGTATWLEHWQYVEETGSAPELNQVSSMNLNVGGNAVGYSVSSTVPTLMLAVATQGGKLAIARITETGTGVGPTYSMSTVSGPMQLPSTVGRAPHWCHCPSGDLIGVGGTNGSLYVLSTALSVQWSYSGQADGSPAINTTPGADSNGDWYFGADDGYVYDVEIPRSGSAMFKAARFGPGGAIRSSPVVGACSSGPCMYFGSTTTSTYFVQLGSTRIIDLRACISSSSGSTTCAANPQLWARVEVGLPAIVGGSGVYVQGWSYYSP